MIRTIDDLDSGVFTELPTAEDIAEMKLFLPHEIKKQTPEQKRKILVYSVIFKIQDYRYLLSSRTTTMAQRGAEEERTHSNSFSTSHHQPEHSSTEASAQVDTLNLNPTLYPPKPNPPKLQRRRGRRWAHSNPHPLS